MSYSVKCTVRRYCRNPSAEPTRAARNASCAQLWRPVTAPPTRQPQGSAQRRHGTDGFRHGQPLVCEGGELCPASTGAQSFPGRKHIRRLSHPSIGSAENTFLDLRYGPLPCVPPSCVLPPPATARTFSPGSLGTEVRSVYPVGSNVQSACRLPSRSRRASQAESSSCSGGNSWTGRWFRNR